MSREFADKEYRHGYMASFLETYIATQIKVLREQRRLTQRQLADRAGLKQSVISRLENSNSNLPCPRLLLKLAEALDVCLVVRFESFGEVIKHVDSFGREALQRPSYENDPAVTR